MIDTCLLFTLAHYPNYMSNHPDRTSSGKLRIPRVEVSSAQQMVNDHLKGRRAPVSVEQVARPTTSSVNTENRATSRPPPMLLSFPGVQVPARNHNPDTCKNPQCHGCGAVIIPSPQLSFPVEDKPLITINEWLIYTIKKPILNSVELDALESRFDFPMPEMIFGNNFVKLVHDPTGKEIVFNALDALDTLDLLCELKVSYHEEWLKSRKKMNEDVLKPYDWTYSTNYRGQSTMTFQKTSEELPISKLLRPDPILFFDELVLFEDELADNGILMLLTKIRVMPTCLLLLCRLFLRIDDVIFRIRDCRIYIDLETNQVLREVKFQEMDYNLVLAMTNRHSDPKKLLRDANWVAQTIPVVSQETEVATLTENHSSPTTK